MMLRSALVQMTAVVIVVFSAMTWAEDSKPATAENSGAAQADAAASIRVAMKRVRPEWTIEYVVPTPIAGIFEVKVSNGPVVYSSSNGDYFITGDLFKLGKYDFINLAEEKRDAERKKAIAGIQRDEMIIFPAIGETKSSIYIFTDIDCGYCRKLHQEVPELNRLGIEVRYLGFPRAGVGSGSYMKLATAWCDKDPNAALTRLKKGEKLPTNNCKPNPVAAQYQLGQQLGVSGTPAIITVDGKLYPGYLPARQLAQRLGVSN